MQHRTSLIPPNGGSLVDLVVPARRHAELFARAAELPSLQLTQRETCDLEMLAIGAFSPLRGFMSEADHKSVVSEMRLTDGTVFPIPINLSTDDESILKIGEDIALRDIRNDLVAILKVEEVYEWDRAEFAKSVLGTDDFQHPVVSELQTWGRFNLSGELQVLK